MLIILSPAKSLNLENYSSKIPPTLPYFTKEIATLISGLKTLKVTDFEKMMDVSKKLAELNFERFQTFSENFTQENSKPALLAFDGDVYRPITTEQFTQKDFEFAQNHVRILSGLYGLLRPMDLIQPYRLEMGTDFKKFSISTKIKAKNLYQFWGDKISLYLSQEAKTAGSDQIINLASEEYFAAINPKKVSQKIINIHFKEKKNGKLKVVGINAKKARGLMTNFAIKRKISDPELLKKFSEENYKFDLKLSSELDWVFTR